jgi:Protein of unknown function (DUF3987)
VHPLAAKIKAAAPLAPLLAQKRWVVWRYETASGKSKPSKVPHVAAWPERKASSKNPKDWCDFEAAISSMRVHKFDGVSFTLAEADTTHFAAFDLDDCRNPDNGALATWAQTLIEECNSYVEITPSGTGFRIIGYGRADPPVLNKIKAPEGGSCEIYRSKPKFIAVTGDALDGWNRELVNIDAAIDHYRRTTPDAGSEDGEDRGADYSRHLGADLDQVIQIVNNTESKDRSADFHKVVRRLKKGGWTAAEIEALFAEYPDGIASKYWARLRQEVDRSYGKADNEDSPFAGGSVQWREPEPIPSGLLPVAAFEPYFLPESIRPWVMDVADRMQCPADYIGITAICVLGSTLGRKIKVRPKQHDDWSVTANFWAAIVGNPGGKKSPSIEQVLKPTLRRFEALANKNFADAKTDFDNKMRVFKLMDDEAEKKARKSKIGLRQAYEAERPMDKPEPPVQARYLTSESTYEKLALIMKDNPNGVTLHRDELISLFRNLDEEEQCNARAFYMTAWNGDDAVTIDRVIRGTDYVEHACLSIIGSTQPDKLVPYVRDIHKGKGGGGLMNPLIFAGTHIGQISWTNDSDREFHPSEAWP